MSKAAVVKGERSLETVCRALDLVPYREALEPWSRVLVKVNFITTKNWATGATTDPLVVEAIINRVHGLGKEAIVVESDAQMTDADKAVVASGMKEMLDRVGVPFVNMRHLDDKVELPVKNGKTLSTIKVARMATDSAIVSAAKLKTHTGTKVTLGMKNMFGMLTTDGFVAMEGRGPVHGKPVQMNTVIASTDPVAADATAARAMGFDPGEVDHIRWAHESGIGQKDGINVLGDGLDAVKRAFARP